VRYLSVDIESTGLDHTWCQMIEFGCVYDDLRDRLPTAKLPRFHCYVAHDRIVGEPYALAMNWKIIDRIARREKGYTYLPPDQFHRAFCEWLVGVGYSVGPTNGEIEVNVAGKNFSGFDKNFISPYLGRQTYPFTSVRFRHRVLDVAPLYFDPSTDDVLPDLKTCLARAGITKEVAHTAIEDAMDVVQLVRYAYPENG
jgi:hypothetical protein